METQIEAIDHPYKTFSAAWDAVRYHQEKFKEVTQETFTEQVDLYHTYCADWWADGTIYRHWAHDSVYPSWNNSEVIAVRPRSSKNEFKYFLNAEVFSGV